VKQPAWIEMSSVAAGLMIAMLVVMWARRPDASCSLSIEPPRHLVLSRHTDREHLATDLSSAERTARRYMPSTGEPADQHARFIECQAALVEQIAARHGLPADVVRADVTNGQ
jgi:hypothetical protein